MSEFMGAALYTKEEIGKALKAYNKEVTWADKLLQEKTKYAESRFKPSFWDKVSGNTTLYKKMDNMFMTYAEELFYRDWIEFTDEEYSRLDELNAYYNMSYLGSWEYERSYLQVKNLYNGGKDCYLNPDQASFVNKYKTKGEL